MINKLYLFLSLSLAVLTVNSQEFISYDKEGILDHFDSSKFLITDTAQSLILEKIDGAKVILKYELDTYGRCYKAKIDFFCSECIDSQLEDALFDDQVDWVELDTNTFISKERISWTLGLNRDRDSECKKMEVIRTPNQEIKQTIKYSTIVLRTTEWRKFKRKKTVTNNSYKIYPRLNN